MKLYSPIVPVALAALAVAFQIPHPFVFAAAVEGNESQATVPGSSGTASEGHVSEGSVGPTSNPEDHISQGSHEGSSASQGAEGIGNNSGESGLTEGSIEGQPTEASLAEGTMNMPGGETMGNPGITEGGIEGMGQDGQVLKGATGSEGDGTTPDPVAAADYQTLWDFANLVYGLGGLDPVLDAIAGPMTNRPHLDELIGSFADNIFILGKGVTHLQSDFHIQLQYPPNFDPAGPVVAQIDKTLSGTPALQQFLTLLDKFYADSIAKLRQDVANPNLDPDLKAIIQTYLDGFQAQRQRFVDFGKTL